MKPESEHLLQANEKSLPESLVLIQVCWADSDFILPVEK